MLAYSNSTDANSAPEAKASPGANKDEDEDDGTKAENLEGKSACVNTCVCICNSNDAISMNANEWGSGRGV